MNTSSKIRLVTLAVAAILLFLGVRLRNPLLTLAAVWLPVGNQVIGIRGGETLDTERNRALFQWSRWLLPILVATCFILPPRLSDDYHRYLWEGHVQNQGYSPYRYAPRTLYPILEHPSKGKINNDDLTAIYPPLAQGLFRLSDLASTSVYAWKALILLLLGLCAWFEPRVREPAIFLSPLILIEGVWNAHLDIIGLLPGFLLVRTLHTRSPLGAGAALAAMVGLKIVPIVLAPICFLHFRGREKLSFTLALLGSVFLIYLPFLNQGTALFDSFLQFSQEWYFNNPIFHLLMEFFGSGVARVILGVGLLGWLGMSVFLPLPVQRKCAWAWIGILVFSPTLYPWYLLWLLPFLAARELRFLHIAYLATCLSYFVLLEYQTTGVWRERFIWMIPEWLVLLYCVFRLLRQEEPRHPPRLPA